MSQPFRSRPTVADLVALSAALARDEQRPRAEVEQRDRALAVMHPGLSDDRAVLALAWLDRVGADDSAVRSLRVRVTSALHACGFAVGAGGLLAGALAALAAFYYDGSGRVNVIAVMAVLVGVPLLFLVAFVVAALPRRVLAWLPGATAWATMARGLSPGRLATLALRFVPRETREALEPFSARAVEHQSLYARVQQWLLLRWAQTFSVTFQIAALATTLALVLFTDLVFGWSTTLASGDPGADAAWVHRFTAAVASPWATWVEAASPTVELIRESRYYRAVDEVVSMDRASRLGGWWPFLVMSMVVYGLVPRLLLLGLATWRLHRAVRHALVLLPGISAVVRRWHAGRVQTTATAETGNESGEGSASGTSAATAPLSDRSAYRVIINWSAVPVRDDVLREVWPDTLVVSAGGAATLAADAEVVARLAARPGDPSGGVAIVVRAWEPPLLEFIDFIQALRRSIGAGTEMVVVPLTIDEAGAMVASSSAHLEVWRRRLGRVGDPWLRVVEMTGEVRS